MSRGSDSLIENLKKEARVRRRVLSLQSSLLLYAVVVIGTFIFVHLAFPATFLLSDKRLLSSLIGLVAAGYAALTAISSSLPGQSKMYQPVATLIALVLWIATDEGIQPHLMNAGAFSSGLVCAKEVVQLSLVPAAFLLLLVWNGAPLRSAYCSFFATCSAGIVANIAMRLCCPSDSVSHDVLFHLTPVALLVALFVYIAGRFFSWDRRVQKLKAS